MHTHLCVKHAFLCIYTKSIFIYFRILIIFSSKEREMHITFRMLTEINQQAIGAEQDLIEIMVHRRIAEQQAQCSVGIAQLLRKVVHLIQSLVYLRKCGGKIHSCQLAAYLLCVGQGGVHLVHHPRETMVHIAQQYI